MKVGLCKIPTWLLQEIFLESNGTVIIKINNEAKNYLGCLFRMSQNFTNWDDIHMSYFIVVISTMIINIIQINVCIEF